MRLQALSLTAAIVLLAGCVTTTPPQSPKQGVYALQAEFAAALTLAVAYHDLPTCGPGVSPICSSPAVRTQIALAASAAEIALTAAQKAVLANPNSLTPLTDAALAVEALVSITSTLKVQ